MKTNFFSFAWMTLGCVQKDDITWHAIYSISRWQLFLKCLQFEYPNDEKFLQNNWELLFYAFVVQRDGAEKMDGETIHREMTSNAWKIRKISNWQLTQIAFDHKIKLNFIRENTKKLSNLSMCFASRRQKHIVSFWKFFPSLSFIHESSIHIIMKF